MPWKKLLAWATGQFDEALRQKLEFVLEETRVYRALLERHSPQAALPAAARVGSVAKFQGQQALGFPVFMPIVPPASVVSLKCLPLFLRV